LSKAALSPGWRAPLWIIKDGRFSFSIDDNGGVEVGEEDHAVLMEGQSLGQRIVADAEGRPFLVDVPDQSPAE
jgi:hypothetical protein